MELAELTLSEVTWVSKAPRSVPVAGRGRPRASMLGNPATVVLPWPMAELPGGSASVGIWGKKPPLEGGSSGGGGGGVRLGSVWMVSTPGCTVVMPLPRWRLLLVTRLVLPLIWAVLTPMVVPAGGRSPLVALLMRSLPEAVPFTEPKFCAKMLLT